MGIDLVYFTVDFICIGLVGPRWRQGKRALQNEKFLPEVGFESSTFR